ncbi:hypothetical protein SORBI_3006G238900, partial [Sorghum bicolor]
TCDDDGLRTRRREWSAGSRRREGLSRRRSSGSSRGGRRRRRGGKKRRNERGEGAREGGEDIGCEAGVGSLIRPTDFSAILASRSGAPVASDARAHVASHRDGGCTGGTLLRRGLIDGSGWFLIPLSRRIACAQHSACVQFQTNTTR